MGAMIYLSGLSGSVSDPRYKHWTNMRAAQFSFPQPIKGPGEFWVTANFDAITAALFQRAASGVSFRYVRMHWLDEKNAPVLKVRFDRVFVSSVQSVGFTDGAPATYVGFVADRWQYEK